MADLDDFADINDGAGEPIGTQESLLRRAEGDVDAAVDQRGVVASHETCAVNPQFEQLICALRNERAAPELLPFNQDLVMGMLVAAAQQKSSLDQRPKTSLARNLAVADLYELDLARARYMLAEYLRIRLAKIHKWASYIFVTDDAMAHLSEEELRFLKALMAARKAHVSDLLLSQLKDGDDDPDAEARMAEAPTTGVHVYASVKAELGTIPAGDDTADLSAGQKVAILYETIAPYVLDGRVDLF